MKANFFELQPDLDYYRTVVTLITDSSGPARVKKGVRVSAFEENHNLAVDCQVPPGAAAPLLSCLLLASSTPPPQQWIPIRWTGGPLELAWRAHTKTLPADVSIRDAIAHWYDPTTLNLLEDSPVNGRLVTWSALADATVETQQQQLVEVYTENAHKRLAVFGLVYAAGDASKITASAAKASLDGLVLDGDFTSEFPAALRQALAPCWLSRLQRMQLHGGGSPHRSSPSRV